ncbi:MAG: hypothetical protein IJ167_08175, partial [Lachnospiraceae bacterium]|nr:hypothetical protein [Lachnospiraceae bacterium]
MKKNMKLKVTALVAMLFMAIAVTFLSFSHADEDIQEENIIKAAETATDISSKTNIDYIAQNSYETDPDVDPYYNIVEIYSDEAAGPSGLKAYIEAGNFKNYVVDSYITDEALAAMKAGMVKYTAYQTKSITNDSTDDLIAISNADLIYVNQGTTPFKVGNDICESLYDILHTYAVGDYKPLIINSESKSGTNGGNNTTTQETMATLATDVFSSGKYYYTFAWDTSKQSTTEFLAHQNGSMYLGINGRTQQSKGKWVTVEKTDADGAVESTKNIARFLVLSSTGTSTSSMKTELLPASVTGSEFDTTDYHVQGTTEPFALPAGSTSKLYNVSGTIVTSSIYNGKYTTPDVVQVDEATLADVDAGTVELGTYDFILIDETVSGNISTDLYNKLAGAMYASVSIVYPSSLATTTTTTTGTDVTNTQEYNYLELYYMVATTDNIARYDNIMVTSKKELDTIMAGGDTGAGAISSLINKSTYRGIGGKGSSSNMYTVLEIQPCYPIDEALAQRQGGKYYT